MFETIEKTPPPEQVVDIRAVPPPPPKPYHDILKPEEPEEPSVKRHKSRIWLIPVCIILALIIGAGVTYAAYRQGYIALPFLDKYFTKEDTLPSLIQQLAAIKSGQSTASLSFSIEPKTKEAKSLYASGTDNDMQDWLAGVVKLAPSDMRVQGKVIVFAGQGSGGSSIDSLMSLNASYASSGVKLEIDAESRVKNSTLYVKINKFPSLGSMELSSITGKWLSATQDEITSASSGLSSGLMDMLPISSAKGISASEMKRMYVSLMQSGVDSGYITATRQFPSEKIDGNVYDKYLLHADPLLLPDVFKKFFREERAYCSSHSDCLWNALGMDFNDISQTELDRGITETFKNASFNQFLDTLHNLPTIELLVERNHQAYRIRTKAVVAFPDSVEKLKDKQGRFEAELVFDKLNQSPNVEKPKDTLPLNEVERLLAGYSEDEWKVKQQAEHITTVRGALASYFEQHQKYPDTLAELLPKASGLNTNTSPRSQLQLAAISMSQLNIGTVPPSTYTLNIDLSSLKEVPQDAYTNLPYQYASGKSGQNYTLSFDMKFPEDKSSKVGYEFSRYADGKNTADKYVPSQEKQADMDSDNDGLTGTQEVLHGTNPTKADSDGDGVSDFVELQDGTDPLDSNSHSVAVLGQTTGSEVGGAITTISYHSAKLKTEVYFGERRAFVRSQTPNVITIVIPGVKEHIGTKPSVKKIVSVRLVDSGVNVSAGNYTYVGGIWQDTDQDGLPNAEEEAIGTSPLIADTDTDGFTDFQEVQSGHDPLHQPVVPLPTLSPLEDIPKG